MIGLLYYLYYSIIMLIPVCTRRHDGLLARALASASQVGFIIICFLPLLFFLFPSLFT